MTFYLLAAASVRDFFIYRAAVIIEIAITCKGIYFGWATWPAIACYY